MEGGCNRLVLGNDVVEGCHVRCEEYPGRMNPPGHGRPGDDQVWVETAELGQADKHTVVCTSCVLYIAYCIVLYCAVCGLQVYPSERHGVRSAECNEHYNTLLLSFLQAGL